MHSEFPSAVPEIPVNDIDQAITYYENQLGFQKDWRDPDGGIAGISKGHCRLFLADPAFRETYHSVSPVVIWLNLHSKQEVDDLYGVWKGRQAKIVSLPEDKPWNLREFTAVDLDGNRLRVFCDFTHDG